MTWEHEKSGTTLFFDVIRHLLILSGTCYVVFLIWQRSWLIALIAAIPIYVILLNLIGFLTVPLYLLTPESRLGAKAIKASEKGDFETAKALTDKFSKEFNVNVPKKHQTMIGRTLNKESQPTQPARG